VCDDDDVMISIETSLCFVVASTIVYPFTEFVSLITTTTWQSRAVCVCVCDDDVMISIETSLCFVVASTIVYPFTEFVSLITTTTWQSRTEQCMCVMMMMMMS
jgi:hypothetical protein